jgi:O-antigen ligase
VTSLARWVTTQRRRIPPSNRIDGPILLDIAALVAFPVLRTLGAWDLLGVWAVAVIVLAIRWPGSGLGLAAAILVYPQPVRIGFSPSVALIAAASIGFALDLALHATPGGPMRRRLAIVVGGVIALGAATMFALFRSIREFGPEISEIAARRWLEFGVGFMFLVLLLWAFSQGSRRPLILGLIGISVAIALSLVDWLAPGLLPSIGVRWLSPGPESSRAAGVFVTPNRLGTVAAIMVVVGACQMLMTDKWRWAWAGLTVLSSVAVLASFSRGALLGLALAVGALIAIRSRRIAVIYVVAVVVIAIVVVPLYVGARVAGSGGTLEILLENDRGRIDAWLAGIRMILEEPIFGHGFHSFRALGERYGASDGLLTAHNEFIGLWAESGVAAIAAYLAVIAGVVGCAIARKTDSWAIVALGAITLFAVAGFFVDTLNFLGVTGVLWLVVAYGIARPLAAAPSEPAPPHPQA